MNPDSKLYKILAIKRRIKELEAELDRLENSNLDKLLAMDIPSPTPERMTTITDIIRSYGY